MRTEIPQERFDNVKPWPYNINWTGGRSSWFENLNYTNLPLNMSPPADVLQQLENVVFLVSPQDPPQLWRNTAYDHYDGSGWTKTTNNPIPVTSEVISRSRALLQGNPVYDIYLNLTAGPNVGNVELPALFPGIQVIAGSFRTGGMVSGVFQPDSPSRLLGMNLETDDYGTLLLSPLLQGATGTNILLNYEVTYRTQDLVNVANNALEGQYAPAGIATTYGSLAGVTLTQRVLDEIAPFDIPGVNAYDIAIAVSLDFRSKYQLMIAPGQFTQRPALGQEVTDWFIQRGGGLPMDFATAYCVFMRHLGIPARMVIGYAVGDPTEAYRTIRVRHMMFWAEVFIPMNGSPTGGEWIQVVPIPLPSSMGGNEIPQNTNPGSVQLYVGPPQWAMIGSNFNLSALLVFQGIPVSTPETIHFRDETDQISMGTGTIQMGTSLPLANITYAFPVGSTLGFHSISATWIGTNMSVTNYTAVYAVGNPNPMTLPHPIPAGGFVPSEVVDLDVKLGLDNYLAHWKDVVHVHGVMTVSGQPVNGTRLRNNQMQIMWDEGWIGNATINGSGYYELSISVNPNDLVRMKVGVHKVWAQYAGEWDGLNPVLLAARSADNSTVAVWGIVAFNLTVRPQSAYRGATIVYDGTARLLNGTVLVGKTIGIFLNGTLVNTATTNASGGFRSTYMIPLSYPFGVAYARVNWTSTMNLVSGNWSNTVAINILVGGTLLSIDSTPRAPQVVHISQSILIYGNLTHATNGSGITGQTIRVWWQNGTSVRLIGSNTTGVGGFYELRYTVPAGYEGTVTYWTQFNSLGPPLISSRSVNMTIRVQKYNTTLTIFSDKVSYHLNETAHIWGRLLFENGTPWPGRNVSINWVNGSVHTFYVTTNSTGWYSFYYGCSVPKDIAGTVVVQAIFTSPNPLFRNSTAVLSPSLVLRLYQVVAYASPIAAQYHLDEVVVFSGNLTFQENGVPLCGAIVTICYRNGTNTYFFNKTTDGAGNFAFRYNCSIRDALGAVYIWARYTSSNSLWSSGLSANRTTTLILYQFQLIANPSPTTCHLDETILITGRLTYLQNGTPLANRNITIHWDWNNGTVLVFGPYRTNATGYFRFYYNCSVPKDRPANITVWAQFNNNVKLWSNASSLSSTIRLILYQIVFTVNAPSPVTLDRVLLIQGNLTYLGGTPVLAGANVTIYLRVGASWVPKNSSVTDSFGRFRYFHQFTVPPDVPGIYVFRCVYIRTSLLTSNATIQIQITAQAINVVIVANGSTAKSYLGQAFTVSGTLRFQNGTPMAGYVVVLDWDSGRLNVSTLTVAGGTFSFILGIAWTQPLGLIGYFVAFNAPSAAFQTAASSTSQVDVWDRVQLHLDTQTVPVVVKSKTFTVSGYVTDGRDRVTGVPLVITVDSTTTWGTASTRSDGGFLVSLTVPMSWSLGPHVVSLSIEYGNYEVQGTADSWSIEVRLGSSITVAFVSPRDTMPGESFSFSIGLEDLSGNPLIGSVSFLLNGTVIATQTISGTTTLVQFVPSGWATSGAYVLSANYSGAVYIDGSIGKTAGTIHIFTSNLFFNHETPSRINPGSALTVKCLLTDDSAGRIPIVGRTVVLHHNGTSNTTTLTTGPDGRITYIVLQRASQGYYEYSVTLVSSVASVNSSVYRVEIQPVSGLPLSAALLIFWTATILTEIIAAYIVIRRSGPSNAGMTKRSRFRLHVGLSRTRSKQVITNASTN